MPCWVRPGGRAIGPCWVHYTCTCMCTTQLNAPQPHCTLHSSNSGLHFGREVASPIGGHRRASGARDRLCSDVIGRGGERRRDEHRGWMEVEGDGNAGQRGLQLAN